MCRAAANLQSRPPNNRSARWLPSLSRWIPLLLAWLHGGFDSWPGTNAKTLLPQTAAVLFLFSGSGRGRGPKIKRFCTTFTQDSEQMSRFGAFFFFGGETIWHEIPIVGGKWQQLAFPLIEDDLRPSSTMQDLAIPEEERDFVRKLQSGTQMGCI